MTSAWAVSYGTAIDACGMWYYLCHGISCSAQHQPAVPEQLQAHQHTLGAVARHNSRLEHLHTLAQH